MIFIVLLGRKIAFGCAYFGVELGQVIDNMREVLDRAEVKVVTGDCRGQVSRFGAWHKIPSLGLSFEPVYPLLLVKYTCSRPHKQGLFHCTIEEIQC
jgi:hypothetical protein